jgi:tetratricopeptide (TPR) repeat protein
MLRFSRRFTVLVACILAVAIVHAQGPSKAEVKPDYSKEAFVFENSFTHIVFENDGTGTRESSARIRIQSDAGVQRYGLLTFAYQNSVESLDIDYVRVVKPDASVVVTSPENTQDMAAEVTRGAPFYSDLREKHVAVKGLSVGDTLEFRSHWTVTKPLASGQFWYAYNFTHNDIVLHEQFQISLPRDRAVKWKSRDLQPIIAEEGARRVFTWTSSQLEHKSTDQEKKDQETTQYQGARGKLPPADVHLSTFQSWEEVGRWYGGLQQERVKPTPEVRAKAAELTKDASDDNAKLRAIYKYVSTQFHYIGIAFGIGRYQPHVAADVLSNQYGDCKDKHTLFASLLDAVGIKAYPALISSSHDLELDVPSPGQFDHVIGVVPQGSGFLWFDTTTEVAPFSYLVKPLRDKQALVIQDDKSPTLVATPVDPPSKLSQTFTIDGKLDDTGTLTGKIERTFQGDDTELLIRSAFRRVPMPQWKDLVQNISYGSGFSGDVSEVTASFSEKTDEPFRVAYSYTRKDYPNWSSRQISSPLPPFLGQTPDKPTSPIILGEPGSVHCESHIELPKGYSPDLPATVDLKEDFAEYHASYAVKDGVLTTDRRLVVKAREVPVTQYEAYKKFAKAVGNDHELYVALSSGDSPADSLQSAIDRLPGSDNPEAARAYDAALAAAQKNNTQGAIDSLKHAMESDPHFVRARMWLSQLYVFTGQRDLALEELRMAYDADPQLPVTYRALVASLLGRQNYDDAISVLREVVKRDPQQADAFSNLSAALLASKRYPEAVDAVQSALSLRPNEAGLYLQLGSAYLHAGDEEKSLKAYKKALEIDPRPLWFNNTGYELAQANKELPSALEYAERAVREEEQLSAKVKLSDLKKEDLAYTSALAAYWDTLGWVYFRMEDLDKAEKYLSSAWILSQSPTIGDHLGQVYEKQQRNEAAAHIYRMALYRSSSRTHATQTQSEEETDARARLEHLSPGSSTDTHSMLFTSDELTRMRTFQLPRLVPKTAYAEFFLLLAPGSKVEDVKFIGGSKELELSSKSLRTVDFKSSFPADSSAHLLRRGILSCYEHTGCTFILYNLEDVRSVN